MAWYEKNGSAEIKEFVAKPYTIQELLKNK